MSCKQERDAERLLTAARRLIDGHGADNEYVLISRDEWYRFRGALGGPVPATPSEGDPQFLVPDVPDAGIHTCTNTATTIDGSPPPRCAACQVRSVEEESARGKAAWFRGGPGATFIPNRPPLNTPVSSEAKEKTSASVPNEPIARTAETSNVGVHAGLGSVGVNGRDHGLRGAAYAGGIDSSVEERTTEAALFVCKCGHDRRSHVDPDGEATDCEDCLCMQYQAQHELEQRTTEAAPEPWLVELVDAAFCALDEAPAYRRGPGWNRLNDALDRVPGDWVLEDRPGDSK